MSMKKSKFVTLSQLASKATGGAYGNHAQAPSLPPSTTTPTPHTMAGGAGGAMPHTPQQAPPLPPPPQKRATWADRVRDKLPPLSDNEYEVLWERGVLGVIFLESEKDGIPYVSKATESCISPMVAPGDILKFVNVVRAKDHSFSDFFKILATMKKPVLLRFERPNGNGNGNGQRPSSPEYGVEPSSSSSFDHQRSASAHDLNTNGGNSMAANAARGNSMKDTVKNLAAKVQRSNSVPQSESSSSSSSSTSGNVQKPVVRGAFWRGSSTKDPRQSSTASTVLNEKDDQGSDGSGSPRETWVGDEDNDGDSTATAVGGGSSNTSEYQLIEVYWETGSLGLFFGEERGTGHPVVTRSTPGVNPSVHRKVQVQDVLLFANGIRSADYTFEAFFARLQQMNKPVKLVFRRKASAGSPVSAAEQPASSASVAAAERPPPIPAAAAVAATNLSRPSRLPPPVSRSDLDTPAVDKRLSPAPSPSLPKSQSNGSLSRQEQASPSSSTKHRTRSIDVERVMEEERAPINGGSIANLRGGKSPSRPDIVYLGSPKRKSNRAPPPPAPPSHLMVDHVPSPRENFQTMAAPPPRVPSPHRQQPNYVPSPTERHASTERRASSERPPSRQQSPIFVLGDDFDASPSIMVADELDSEEEETEEEVESEQPQIARPMVEKTHEKEEEVEQEVEEEEGLEIEEGVAVGVPVEANDMHDDGFQFEATEIMGEQTHFRGHHAEAAEVAEAIVSGMMDDAFARVKRTGGRRHETDEEEVEEDPDYQVEMGLPIAEESIDEDDDDSANERPSRGGATEPEDGEPLLDALDQEDPDISSDRAGNEDGKSRDSLSSSGSSKANNKAAVNASLAKYKKRAKNSRPLVKLPAISEDTSQTVPLTAPNAVNTSVQVRGRMKPKPNLIDTPDSSTYLVKWKDGRSVGLQLREVRLGKGTFPLVVDVCKEPCCDALKHVCIGDVIVEINSRNCSSMGVKKTVSFLKTSSKTMLLKFRRGPAFLNERVSASL